MKALYYGEDGLFLGPKHWFCIHYFYLCAVEYFKWE